MFKLLTTLATPLVKIVLDKFHKPDIKLTEVIAQHEKRISLLEKEAILIFKDVQALAISQILEDHASADGKVTLN